MNPIVIIRVLVTFAIVLAAYFVGEALWRHYETDPWTRDGRISADVLQVAPDVSGLVTEVLVRDNQQVRAGAPLFIIDRPRYELAVKQAQAALATQRVQIAQAQREARRNRVLGDLVPAEELEQGDAKVAQLQAELARLQVQLETARLNLARTVVRSGVDGTITNFDLRPGDYATAGRAEFAIIDRQSIHAVGYFEETKLPRIAPGDRVQVHLMGEDRIIDGHVQSIASGIDDRDRTAGDKMLPNVNPTFNWVRLAQRVPVRIVLDRVPAGLSLVVGRTATVNVIHREPIAPPQQAGGAVQRVPAGRAA
ncbi:efflux RND transporter periplasmic adaptor subunit [Sphingomonas sp. 3-13AW]|jgi:multidrug resistance efflux pump|uniref:efflux RND transporter periplasmic adaptor subunit n=1 Tax=Sphingomonas sp. 3-13AW TaxID=3050450 RepID=UPI003BB4DE2B